MGVFNDYLCQQLAKYCFTAISCAMQFFCKQDFSVKLILFVLPTRSRMSKSRLGGLASSAGIPDVNRYVGIVGP